MNEIEYAAGLFEGAHAGAARTAVQETRGSVEPPIRYARTSDGVNIADYTLGSGTPLVYLAAGGGLSHLAAEWRYPEQRAWLEHLAAKHTLIRLDHRGVGLSDRDVDFDLRRAVRDIHAVVTRERLKRFALFAQLHTSITAILYANQYPEAVSQLILWSPFASYNEFLESSPAVQAAVAAAGKDWYTFTEIIAQSSTAWKELEQARRYAAYLRECADESYFLRSGAHFQNFDVTAKLAETGMPVLVLHRREAFVPGTDLIKNFVAAVPRARLIILEGAALMPFLGFRHSA
jgi:pimeloyl-ACP methyl ester carboxylesterase